MVRMTVGANGSASISQSVYLKAGTYTLSGDIYRNSYSDVDVTLKAQPASGSALTEKFHFDRVYDYPESAEASLTFDVPSDGTYTVSLMLTGKASTASGSSINVRHMTLARSIGFSSYSRVENGSFERSSGSSVTSWEISRRDAYNYTYSESVDSRITEIKHYVFGGDANAAYYGFDPNETSKTLREDTQYNYNDYGQPTSIYVYSGGERTENYMSYVSGNSRIVGALVSEIDTTGVTYRYFYDENTGELLASGNVDSGNGMAYTYDAVGRMTQAVPATVTLSSGSEYTYSSVSDSANVSYTYDTCGRLGGITTDTTTYTFTYDIFGNSSSVKVGGSEIASYTYGSNNGKLETLTYGNGVSVKYVYDELDRISKVCYNAGSGTSFSDAYLYTYDSNGNLNKVEDLIADKVTIFRYDSRGRLCEYYVNDSDNEQDQSALCLRYDEEGRLKTQIYTRYYKYGSGSISFFSFDQNFSYNEIDGTLSGCVIDGDGYSRAINYSYDDFGRLSTVGKSMVTLDGDGVGQNVSYTYVKHSDPDDGTITYNRIGSVTNEYTVTADDETTTVASETFTYTYDASGNITEIKNNGSTLFRYHYDLLDQLTREDNAQSGRTYVYEYDNAGNIKSKKTYGYTTSATVSTTLYSTQTYGYGSGISGDILTSLNGSTISYDGALNPLSYVINGSECTLTWTQGRRLASISGEEEGTDYTYTYNDEGIRTGKTVDGVEHIYHLSGTQILSEEWTENGVQHLIVYSYDASGSPISMTYRKSTDAASAEEVYFLASNPQGDITYIYDIDGNRVVTYNYDAWGNILSISGTKASTIGRYNPFRYRGYYYDTETSLYYLNSRYYDPNVGRFLNADGQLNDGVLGYNLFAYCENNPVNYIDPMGNWPNWGKLAMGALLTTVAVGFLAVSIMSLGTATCFLGVAAAVVTAVASTSIAVIGTSEVVEAFTGENYIRNAIGDDAYEVVKDVSISVATLGATMIDSGVFTCFVAGTQIATEEGSIAIEDIRVGMKVYAHDPETGENALKEVANTFVRESGELVHITVNGEEITTTPTHPFYVPQKGWTDAIRLRAGDRLQLLNGEYVVIEQVQHEILETPVTVYNFEVEEFHTYYVTGSAILVHNANCGDVSRMTNGKANEVRDKIISGDNMTFKSKSDAVAFIKWKFPTFPQEVAGHRSAQGWHFDAHEIEGVFKDHSMETILL